MKIFFSTTHQCFWICGAIVIDFYFEVTELSGKDPNWQAVNSVIFKCYTVIDGLLFKISMNYFKHHFFIKSY